MQSNTMMQSNMIKGETDPKAQNKILSMEKISDKGLMVPSIKMEQGTKPSESSNTPALLLELVTLVSQIAQLDSMFDKVNKSAPDAGSEAVKWHQVSVQALETSRKYMIEQQTSLIKRLANATGTPIPALCGNIALQTPKEDAPVAHVRSASPPGLAPPPGLASPPGLDIPVDKAEDTSSPKSEKPSNSGDGNSLRTDLEKIKLYPNGCALLVRKIKPLGFDSAEHLRAHFEQFGQVAEVLVSHCITKPSPKRANGRVRPAALGFVIMASSEDVDKVFAHGEQQCIQDVIVEVTKFRDGSEADSGSEENQ